MENIKSPEAERSNETNLIVNPEQSLAQEYDIDAFLAKRKEFITKVNAIMIEGQDYHIIQGKKSLAKGGAEKIASIFGWTANFQKDSDTLEMLGGQPGLVAYACVLGKTGTDIKTGEGRGASTLQKNGGDPNKTIKMAQKSAFIDAVLRASGLSDFFTQDLEDMNPTQILDRPVKQNSAPGKAEKLGDDNHTGFFCSVHDNTIILRPAGVTKQGKEYPAFYACNQKVNGSFCKAAILNSEGQIIDPRELHELAKGKLEDELPTITIDQEDMP